MISLNNVTTQNTYVDANTRLQPETGFLHLTVTGAAIFWQYQLPDGDWYPAEEVYQIPVQRGIKLDCRGFRCRSAVGGVPAQVTATMFTATDLPG
jgi:hypothetical protein